MSWTVVEYDKTYDISSFDCGVELLNVYLKTQMSQDLRKNLTVPVLAINADNKVIGFYTLSGGSISFSEFPENLQKKVGRYPVPISRIGRLAVDITMKGQGLGEELLMHAIDRARDVGQLQGTRAIIVDAKDAIAENFYLKYGFQKLTNDSKRSSLFLIL